MGTSAACFQSVELFNVGIVGYRPVLVFLGQKLAVIYQHQHLVVAASARALVQTVCQMRTQLAFRVR